MSSDNNTSDLETRFFDAVQGLLGANSLPLTNGQKRHLLQAVNEVDREQLRPAEAVSFRGGLDSMSPYLAGRSIQSVKEEFGLAEVVKLGSNEHARGASPKSIDVIRDLIDETHRYPEVRPEDLMEAIASHYGVDTDQIFLGCGSNEVFDTIVRVLRPLGAHAVFSTASFSMYRHVMKVYGVPYTEVPIDDHGQNLEDLGDAVLKNDATLVFVNTPHNPTGQVLMEDEVRAFMDRIGESPIVILDEAYLEYAANLQGVSVGTKLLKDYKNLIVCRTFSKAYGLAGLRIGYGIGRSELMDLLNRVRQPFNLTRFSAPAALAALKDQDWLNKTILENNTELDRLRTFFEKHRLDVSPSRANFLLVNLPTSAQPLCEQLLQSGVVVRPLQSYGLPKSFRMTVGTPAHNDRFMEAFDNYWTTKER